MSAIMKNNLFQNKEINLKRIRKGLTIGLPVAIMVFVICNHYINLIDDSLRDKYQTEKIVYVDKEKVVLVDKNDVLGEEITIEQEFPDEFDRLTESYGIEEYVLNWDGKLEGYREQYPYIFSPRYYLSGEKDKVSESWILKNGYKLVLDCPEIELSKVIPADPYACKVEYNNKLIKDSVRYDIHTWEESKSLPSSVALVVYSPEYNDSMKDFEILIIGEYRGGSFDEISVYRLIDGKANHIPFYYNEENRDVWTVENPMYVSLYYNDEGDIKVLTGYHEPSMGPVRAVLREWKLEKESLTLERTFGNIVD